MGVWGFAGKVRWIIVSGSVTPGLAGVGAAVNCLTGWFRFPSQGVLPAGFSLELKDTLNRTDQ